MGLPSMLSLRGDPICMNAVGLPAGLLKGDELLLLCLLLLLELGLRSRTILWRLALSGVGLSLLSFLGAALAPDWERGASLCGLALGLRLDCSCGGVVGTGSDIGERRLLSGLAPGSLGGE